MVHSFQESRETLSGIMHRLPAELDESSPEWQRLSAEMAANIHLGLEAGECVSRVPSFRAQRSHTLRRASWSPISNWRPVWAGAGIATAAVLLIGSAWWLNLPTDAALLGRTFERLVGREPLASANPESRGALVQTSTKGIEFHENGGSLGMNLNGTAPTYTSVSFEGSASASYVDLDTGQVTVAKVYVQ